MKLYVNLFCRDIEAQLAFYSALLGLPELAHARSPIYRALAAPGFQFGLHAPAAYGLLQLDGRSPQDERVPPVTAYPTFMLDQPADVSTGAERALALGGAVLKPPYATYYGEWQTVLSDPEGHVFRLSCAALPEGVQAAVLSLP